MIYQLETAQTILNEGSKLLFDHWEEIAHYQDITINIDEDLYLEAEKSGNLKVFTARNDELKLVGYAIFFIRRNAHYKDSIQATQDVLYVDPEYRGKGGAFIFWCEEKLRSFGVQVVYHHVKVKHDWGKLLEQNGYDLIEKVYGKRLL